MIHRSAYDDEPILTKPDAIAGLKFSDYLNTMIDWTDDLKNKLQQELRYRAHETRCLGTMMPVSYPEIKQEYVEEDVCEVDENNSAHVVRTFSLSALIVLFLTLLNNF